MSLGTSNFATSPYNNNNSTTNMFYVSSNYANETAQQLNPINPPFVQNCLFSQPPTSYYPLNAAFNDFNYLPNPNEYLNFINLN